MQEEFAKMVPESEQGHSGLGVASFVISLVAGIGLAVLILFAGVAESTTPGGLDDGSVVAGVIGVLLLVMLMALVVALVLGIIGMTQRTRNKVFAILGTVFSSLALLGGVFLMLLGMVME